MSIALSTAGMLVKYAVESTAGTRPTSGYTTLPDVKQIPEFGGEPNSLQTTDLSKTEYHTYIAGLRDPGGAIGLTVNDTAAFRTAWEALITAYNTGKASGLSTWIEFAYGDSSLDSFFFEAEPVSLGFGGAEVDSVLENTAYLMPNGKVLFATAST